jgi:hypothetical protein
MSDLGWQRIGPHPALRKWADAALPVAISAIASSDERWRCGGTWFVGVDALENDPSGRIGDAPFPWEALPLTPQPLHRAQLSTLRPGYPQPSADETEAAFRYRQTRDAAHLDGLLPFGPDKRRMIREPHAWILGIALNICGASASPLTVWEGSHTILRAALARALSPHPPDTWADIDITDAYQTARKEVFATCPRHALPVEPGEATLLDRHMLHGTAAWQPGAKVPPEGRIIAYFRPQLPSVADWL